MALNVGVVGTGGVGTTLGGQLLKAQGFTVRYASRDPTSEKIKNILKAQPEATAGTTAEVVAPSDVLILAVPGSQDDAGIGRTAASLGNVAGKVIIDATNPLGKDFAVRWEHGTSAGEILAAALPDAYVFKAFNTVGVELMGKPEINGQQLTLLFAGPKEKEDVASKMIAGVGFIPKYVGPIRYARNLEAIAELWIDLSVPFIGQKHGQTEDWGRGFHFQVI